MLEIRHDRTRSEIAEIYFRPLLELISEAVHVHRQYHNTGEVQVCTLLSVKTGSCSEDCGYCSQSARYDTGLESEKLMDPNKVLEIAQQAKNSGSTRFCMGAAWRGVRDNDDFDNVLEMVKGVNQLGLEVCCTLGSLEPHQAEKLKEAGLTAYNHNIDTSPEYYDKVITTRTINDRLETIKNVTDAQISVCSGGIIGLGESDEDRIGMLHTLSNLPVHPESVPVNALVPVEGTPLETNKKVEIWEMVRMIATARIIMPKAKVRLSAGRESLSELEQAFCFMAGANSIFSGEKLLTAPNQGVDADKKMFELLGITPMAAQTQMKEIMVGSEA